MIEKKRKKKWKQKRKKEKWKSYHCLQSQNSTKQWNWDGTRCKDSNTTSFDLSLSSFPQHLSNLCALVLTLNVSRHSLLTASLISKSLARLGSATMLSTPCLVWNTEPFLKCFYSYTDIIVGWTMHFMFPMDRRDLFNCRKRQLGNGFHSAYRNRKAQQNNLNKWNIALYWEKMSPSETTSFILRWFH